MNSHGEGERTVVMESYILFDKYTMLYWQHPKPSVILYRENIIQHARDIRILV
jgi:hypothetical protein